MLIEPRQYLPAIGRCQSRQQNAVTNNNSNHQRNRPPPPSLSVSVLGDDDEDAVRLSALGSINHTSFLFFSDSIPWFHVVQCAVVPLFPFSIDDRNVNGQIIIISE